MIYAMFSMVLLTFLVGILAVCVRIRSVMSGRVKIKYYRSMHGQDVPESVTKSTRCFNNMFEVPVLFYVVATLFVSLHIASPTAITLAWVFVGLRVVHTIVHLTYNNVLHRMLMFWGGLISVFLMWLLLLSSLA